MPTTPVLVLCWLDPPLQTDFSIGASVRWHAAFTDPITRQLVDPDIVTFAYSVPPVATAVSFTYPTLIVKDTLGQYHLDLPLTTIGRWALNVTAQGNPGAVQIGSGTLMINVFSAGI